VYFFNLKRVLGTEYIADRLDILSASLEIFFYISRTIVTMFICFFWIPVTLLSGLERTEAASHRSHSASHRSYSMEACIPSQASCCGLYRGRIDNVTGFCPLSPLSIIPPILYTHIFFICHQPAPN